MTKTFVCVMHDILGLLISLSFMESSVKRATKNSWLCGCASAGGQLGVGVKEAGHCHFYLNNVTESCYMRDK